MNVPILIVACISTLAVLGHVFGGTRDTASLAPSKDDKKLTRNWKQAMGAFQMLAVDLLLVTITLFLSLMFFLWGIVWLIQMFWLKSEVKTNTVAKNLRI